jgi:hypothetical protein
MRIGRNNVVTLEADAPRFLLYTHAALGVSVLEKDGAALCSVAISEGEIAVSVAFGAESFVLRAPVAMGNEVILTRDGRRLALYVEGVLYGEEFPREYPDFAGATWTGGFFFHFEAGYTYSAAAESVLSPLEEDFAPRGGGTLSGEVSYMAAGLSHRFLASKTALGYTKWSHLLSGDGETYLLAPDAVTPAMTEADPTGAPFPLFALGALYLFCPTAEGVRVLVAKDQMHFAKTPVAFAQGALPTAVTVAEEGGIFRATVSTPEGTLAFTSPDLFHWEA